MKRATVRKGRLVAPEDAEQITVMEWAAANEYRYPQLAFLLHIPNGGSRRKAEAVKLRRMGVKPGVPDLFLPVPRGSYAGLWIEMKRKDGVLSSLQSGFLQAMASFGYCCAVCRGADEAIARLEAYLKLPGRKNPPC